MALTNEQITAKNFKEFYEQIRPYLNGSFPTPVANKMSKGDLYSTNERMIGQWIDGKPLYQKCYSVNTPSSTSGYVSILTLDATIEVKRIDGWITQNSIPINSYASSSYYISTEYRSSDHIIEQWVKGYTNKDEVIILQYTKSTDSAISIGNETDYSTDEKIIGTWIDGKPIYQKTIDCGAMPNSTLKSIPHNVSNMGLLIREFGVAYKSDYSDMVPLPSSTSGSNTLCCSANTTNIKLITVTNLSQYNAYVTIQYLKTTD